jgi:ABC-type transport system involved in cytochrome c biogenesis permease subunit
MNQGCSPNPASARHGVTAGHMLALFVAGLLLAGVMQFIGAQTLRADTALDQLFSYKLTISANLLLLAAAGLYLAHLWLTDRAVGLWATWLSLLGALGLVSAILARGTETYMLHRVDYAPLTNLHEILALFCALTVLLYLVMEHVYRSRSAGAFVMPLVALAVLFEGWLMSSEPLTALGAGPVVRSYLVLAHVLSNVGGYGAFAVALALALKYLLRDYGARGLAVPERALRGALDQAGTGRLMHLAVACGFLLFSLGLLLGMYSAYLAQGRYWDWAPKQSWSLLVWLTYAGYLVLHYGLHWRGTRMAWWVLLAFGLTVFGLLGLPSRASGWHLYG